MKATYYVQADVRRVARALTLRDRLVVMGVDPILVLDEASAGPWSSCRAILEKPCDTEWKVIVQDDAILADRFVECAEAILTHASRPSLVSFYTWHQCPAVLGRRIELDEREGKLVERKWWTGGVGYAIKTAIAADCIAWAGQQAVQRRDDDRIIGEYLMEAGETAVSAVPSIVDHDEAEPSLMGHRTIASRKAWRFRPAARPAWWVK